MVCRCCEFVIGVVVFLVVLGISLSALALPLFSGAVRLSLLFVSWCFCCSCCSPCCWHVYLYCCAVLPAIVCCYAVVCSCVLVCAVVLLCLCLVFVFLSILFSSLLSSSLFLSCLVLALSCLVLSSLRVVLGVVWCHFGSSWGLSRVILVVLEAFGGHFWSSWGLFRPLGVLLGRSWEVLEALRAVLNAVDASCG